MKDNLEISPSWTEEEEEEEMLWREVVLKVESNSKPPPFSGSLLRDAERGDFLVAKDDFPVAKEAFLVARERRSFFGLTLLLQLSPLTCKAIIL